jgi:hypothetical protein
MSIRWTKDLPTEPGWYWLAFEGDKVEYLEPMRVDYNQKKVLCLLEEDYDGNREYGPLSSPYHGQWWFRIEIPVPPNIDEFSS